MADFDFLFNDNPPEIKEDKRKKKKRKTSAKSKEFKARQKKLQRLENLKEIVTLPEDEEIIFITTKGHFDAITFLDLIVEKAGEIEECYMASYGLSKDATATFRYYLEKGIIKKMAYLGTTALKARFPIEYEKLLKLQKDFDFTIKLTYTHAKIYLFKTELGYFTVQGSGNLSMNSKLENYSLCNSKEIFDFFKENFE